MTASCTSARAWRLGLVGLFAGACQVVLGIDEAAAGEDHTCVRLAEGSLRCWGRGEHGEMGAGFSIAVQSTPLEPDVPCP
jgi:hypothetical protein